MNEKSDQKFRLKKSLIKKIRTKLCEKLEDRNGSIFATVCSEGPDEARVRFLKTSFRFSYEDEGNRFSNSAGRYLCFFHWDGTPIRAYGCLKFYHISHGPKLKLVGSCVDHAGRKSSLTLNLKGVGEKDMFEPDTKTAVIGE